LKKVTPIINYVLLPAFGIFLLLLSLKGTNFKELKQVLISGNYWTMLPVFLVSILVYIFRVARWKILLKSIQLEAKPNVLLAALATGYLVNFAIPRLGEVSRAVILKRQQNFQINHSLATIVFERMIDVLCLMLIFMVAFLTELGKAESIFKHFTADVDWFNPKKIMLLAIAAIVIGLAFFALRRFKTQIGEWVQTILEKMSMLLKMKGKTWFLLYTLFIWIGFYLMTYLWFFMFQSSSKLTAYDAFIVMVLGVIARTLPIQAGSAGAYHYVVSSALVLMGLNLATGNALAIVIHGFQTVFTIVFGFSAYLWLLYQKNEQT